MHRRLLQCLFALGSAQLLLGCEGPGDSARQRYIGDDDGASADDGASSDDGPDDGASDDGADDAAEPPVQVEPYPEWGELTSACGEDFAQERLFGPAPVGAGVEEPPSDAGAPEAGAPTFDATAPMWDAGLRDAGVPEVGLRELGLRDLGYTVGTALAAHRLGNPGYASTAARDFNLVTPENEMKWDAIEPAQGRFSFGSADEIVRFAVDHDMLIKGHTLVWHSQLPNWVNALPDADAVRDAMTNHIEVVMGHYRDEFPGRVVVWDVVNEALDSQDDQVFYRDSVFHRELGEGFIAEAFEIARQAEPDALLFYNDFGIESLGAKSQATFEMVRDLVEAGVPIDGVGFQMHTPVADIGPTVADFARNLERYIELGVLVSISEMDVNLCRGFEVGFETRADAIEAQRVRYRRIIDTCIQHDACHSVSVWGMADSDSWLNDQQQCENPAWRSWPLLYTDEYERKPAWWGVFDALSGCAQQ